jgi:glycerol-3-phosphate O-acyltransferase / dihydroxyacetone phosphate acyltransferase
MSAVIEVNRRFVKGYTLYKTDPRIEKTSNSIRQYNKELQLLGLHDNQVEYTRFSVLRVLTSLVYRVGKLGILAVGTLPGLLLFSPIFIAARYYSHKMKNEALAGSSIKIQGTDVMATWKTLVAGGLAPLLYTYYAVILAIWTHYNRANGIIPNSTPISSVFLMAYIIFPRLTFAALRLGEIGMDILKSLRPLVLCLSPFSAGTLTKLRTRR